MPGPRPEVGPPPLPDPGPVVVRRRPPSPVAEPRRAWVLVVVMVLGVAPMLLAAAVLARRGWIPVGELAQAELRLRDFWAHPPSLGAVGRLRTATQVSSHPGPAAWWAMYPVYALFGRDAGAVSLAVAAVAAAWASLALGLLWRRGGDAAAVLGGIVVCGLVAALGPLAFVEPWNPWFAVPAFLCVVLGVWDLAEGHTWSLVLVVAAGSYAAQAHVGYAPVVGGLVLAGAAGWLLRRPTSRTGRPVAAALLAAAVVGAALWALPVAEQLRNDPGNLTVLWRAYARESATHPALGLGDALGLVGAFLDPSTSLVALDDPRPTGRAPDAGTALLVLAWGMAAVTSFRRRREPAMGGLLGLHCVAAAGLVAAVVAASRIVGEVFGYLILWLPVLVATVVLAVGWTAWLCLPERARRARRIAASGLAVVLVAGSLANLVRFADPPTPSEPLASTVEALLDGVVAGVDPRGSYLVRWDDPLAFGSVGQGVLSELERRGVRVGVDDRLRVEMRPHRVLAAEEADGALWVVTGAALDRWRHLPGVQELASYDPRTPSELARASRLHDEVEDELTRLGGPGLAERLDENYWATRSDPRVPEDLARRVDELTALGLPTAVFLTGADTAEP